jgi:hypothetical protein
VDSGCDGSFEGGLGNGTCLSVFAQPEARSAGRGFQLMSSTGNGTSATSAPSVPEPETVADGGGGGNSGGTQFAQLLQDSPGAAQLVFTKFISSPDEELSFKWYVCTSANFTDGPYSYDSAAAGEAAAGVACEARCSQWCGQNACDSQCRNPSCIIDCYKRCTTCQQDCSSALPVQAFRADLFQVSGTFPAAPLAASGELDPSLLPGDASRACERSAGCLATLVNYTTASDALCTSAWQETKLSMSPYVGTTVAVSGLVMAYHAIAA